MREIFQLPSTEPGFPKIYRQLPKIAEVLKRLPKITEDFLTTSEDNQRCRKIFDDFKTGNANNFKRISNQSQALFKSSEDVPDDNFSNVFKQLHSLLSVRREKLVWMREIRILLYPQAWDSRIMRARESWGSWHVYSHIRTICSKKLMHCYSEVPRP